ncbi:MAG: hypothetical protein H3Z52_10445 [archaeon]|nr:hypothetical protein [archaeon]MCP8321340.1 hypothetical protein [archaeon]
MIEHKCFIIVISTHYLTVLVKKRLSQIWRIIKFVAELINSVGVLIVLIPAIASGILTLTKFLMPQLPQLTIDLSLLVPLTIILTFLTLLALSIRYVQKTMIWRIALSRFQTYLTEFEEFMHNHGNSYSVCNMYVTYIETTEDERKLFRQAYEGLGKKYETLKEQFKDFAKGRGQDAILA